MRIDGNGFGSIQWREPEGNWHNERWAMSFFFLFLSLSISNNHRRLPIEEVNEQIVISLGTSVISSKCVRSIRCQRSNHRCWWEDKGFRLSSLGLTRSHRQHESIMKTKHERFSSSIPIEWRNCNVGLICQSDHSEKEMCDTWLKRLLDRENLENRSITVLLCFESRTFFIWWCGSNNQRFDRSATQWRIFVLSWGWERIRQKKLQRHYQVENK